MDVLIVVFDVTYALEAPLKTPKTPIPLKVCFTERFYSEIDRHKNGGKNVE
jgi:hypothetical protein